MRKIELFHEYFVPWVLHKAHGKKAEHVNALENTSDSQHDGFSEVKKLSNLYVRRNGSGYFPHFKKENKELTVKHRKPSCREASTWTQVKT